MAYLKLSVLYLAILLAFPFCSQSCHKEDNSIAPTNTDPTPELPSPAPVQPQDTINDTPARPPVDPESATIRFEILFTAEPGEAKASVAPLKYNKQGWTSVEWDDNSPATIKAYNIAKNKFYTDGCGNKVPYTGAVAVIGMNQYLCNEVADGAGNVNYFQMKELIAAGWDIENHSFYHEPTGNCNYGSDWFRNIKELDELILKRVGYKMNGAVVPVNYEGFATAAKKFGYTFCASQGTFDGLLPAGNPTWKPTNDFALAPKDFSAFGRIFHDQWADMEKDVKATINELVLRQNHYFRFASHGIDEAAFKRIVDYFESTTNDKFLFLSTREIMEYRLVASLPIKYQKEQNKLIVEIDTSTLPDRVRWRDLSFVINATTGAKIASVNILSGLDKISFNPNSGLVNIFKQIQEWK